MKRAWSKLQRTFSLSWVGAAWVAVAASVVALAFLVLSAASEDVVNSDGMATHDPARLHWFITHRPDGAVRVARMVTMLGNPMTLTLVAIGGSLWLWRRGARLMVASAPALSLGLAGAAAALSKAVVGRPRPSVGLHLVTETEPSFPSGHATDSTAVFLTLALVVATLLWRSPRARAAIVAGAVALAGSVGLSRLTLGVHWPSDVLAGWALGTMVATFVSTTVMLLARVDPGVTADTAGRSHRILTRLHGLGHAHRPLTSSSGAT